MADRLTEENIGTHQRKQSTSTQSRTDFPVNLAPTTLRRTSRAPGPNSSRRHVGRAQSQSTISGQHDGHMYHHAPLVKLEPSYQMSPNDKHKFSAGRVEKFMQPLLESYLDGRTYESKECASLSKGITEAMKTRVKDMDFKRYKFIVNVTIGQNRNQGFQYASREVWNADTDNYASVFYQNSSLFAVATIFATYYE